MDNRAEIKAFLSSRRAKITPEQAGLSAYARNRRVPGLRRSEVADLAGVSVEYYAQLERGGLGGVSGSVLEALARALQLDEAEHAHLLDLARAAGPGARTRRRTPAQQVRPTIQRLLNLMTEVPVIVNNARLDLVASNPLGQALFAITPGSPSSTPAPTTSGSTGNALPTTASPSCALRLAVTPTTRPSPAWSANCPRAVRLSASAGPPTTSACTVPASSISTTPSSVTCT
jgi:transcriptional regulator with XRE-family HTH domain